ncbi:MAG TPA: hypothetical protein VJN94_15585 [Candidatus Binataceae bacterium]|nr:hypothetical protein [Candidatus Binataceae bacterium]
MHAEQLQFLLDDFFQFTLAAAVQHGPLVYAVEEEHRQPVRDWLRHRIDKLWPTYAVWVSERQHLDNIQKLAGGLAEAHGDLLHNQIFTIGRAQKVLNLYLKYLWCAHIIKRAPPHCPFDNLILQHLGWNHGWHALNTMQEYEKIVGLARANANGVELAQWELVLFNHRP